MTDFTHRPPAGDATAANQALMIAAIEAVEAAVEAVETAVGTSAEQTIETLVDGVVFNTSDETYTSASVECDSFTRFCLLVSVAVTGAPTDIQIIVQFSDNDTDFYSLMNGPFGDLRYEDAAGNKAEAITGEVNAAHFRVVCLSSGCDTGKEFDVTVKVVLME